ncbi:MAG: hypothetical protein KAF91_12020 [Nostoc sp. TH1S01]|nr:hypothetical protein [Nostoc sp. TH1S01]
MGNLGIAKVPKKLSIKNSVDIKRGTGNGQQATGKFPLFNYGDLLMTDVFFLALRASKKMFLLIFINKFRGFQNSRLILSLFPIPCSRPEGAGQSCRDVVYNVSTWGESRNIISASNSILYV